jgi:acyl-CoA hydrolase|tara:strand:+ start:310 stop:834 length:525 start_codon:yes stop_codon:yes gene_type:complete
MKNMEEKKIATQSTKISMSEMVMPNDTNNLNTLFGGKLMYWMDMAAAICANKHTNNVVVTASVDNITFKAPIHKGDIVTLNAFITRVFNTSMEIFIEVTAQNSNKKEKIESNTAFFTFVALNQKGKPVKVNEIYPENKNDKKLFDGALRRRQLRLILAGKMKPEDANELKSIFN